MSEQILGTARDGLHEVEAEVALVHPLRQQYHERRVAAYPRKMVFAYDVIIRLHVGGALVEGAHVVAPSRLVDAPERRGANTLRHRLPRRELSLPHPQVEPVGAVIAPEAGELGLLAVDRAIELEPRTGRSARMDAKDAHGLRLGGDEGPGIRFDVCLGDNGQRFQGVLVLDGGGVDSALVHHVAVIRYCHVAMRDDLAEPLVSPRGKLVPAPSVVRFELGKPLAESLAETGLLDSPAHIREGHVLREHGKIVVHVHQIHCAIPSCGSSETIRSRYLST